MRRLPQLGIATLLAALAVGGWYWAARSESSGPPTKQSRQGSPVAVESVPARTGTVQETVVAVGTTRAAKSVQIVPTVAGLITRIAFEPGQRVQTGAVLFELDSTSERAGVREVESELSNLRAQSSRAEALRTRKLLPAADVDELRGKLGMAEARLEALQNQRDKRTLRAPFSGVVGLRNVNLGAYVDTSTVLTTLDDRNTIELEFKVPERYFSTVKPGQALQATSVAFPNQRFGGTVRHVDTRIEPTTRSFRVRAELPNPDAVLPQGLFMAVSLVVAERRNVVLVPEEAIIREGLTSYAYVVNEGVAVRTAVTVGQRQDAAVEVVSGLAANVEVVIKGHQSLRDKTPIRTPSQESAPAPKPKDDASPRKPS